MSAADMNQAKAVACRAKLIDLLNAQIDKMAFANEFMRKIKSAMAEDKLERLSNNITGSQLPLDDLEKLDQQRQLILLEFGFSKDRQGLEKCIEWCDDNNASTAKLYQQLVQSLMELQTSIQLNSLMVNKGRERIRRSIGILTGVNGLDTNKTYDNSGQAQTQIGPRNIAIA